MTSTHPKLESALLLAMANAQTTDEQRQIAAELETVRRAKRTQDEADRMSSLSLAALAFPDSDTERHTSTASSDWLADIEVPQVDRTEMENQMRAQATVWLQGRPAEVRADGEEFRTQAASKAHYLSNHFPGHREAAVEAFLDQIRTLAVEDWARSDDDAVSVSDADQHEKVEFEGATADEEAETSASDSPSLAEGTEPEGDTPMDDSDPAWQGKNHDDSTFNREDAGQTVASRAKESARKMAARECSWTYLGEDDGGNIHWWECTTHGKEEMGGPPGDEPPFPCQGWLDESRTSSRKTAASTSSLSVGDRVMLTQDGKEREFEVTSIAPPGSTGRAESAGPRVTVTLVGGQGYNVSFDDHSQPGISSWSKVSARTVARRKTAAKVKCQKTGCDNNATYRGNGSTLADPKHRQDAKENFYCDEHAPQGGVRSKDGFEKSSSRKTAAEWKHEPAQELDLGIGHYPADRWTLTRGESSALVREVDPAAGTVPFRWSVDASPTNRTVETGSAQSLEEAKSAAEAALNGLSSTASRKTAAERPINYPYNSASSIYDAQAFRLEGQSIVHKPVDYPTSTDLGGQVVVAACGVQGQSYTSGDSVGDGLPGAEWAGDWDDKDYCPDCWSVYQGPRGSYYASQAARQVASRKTAAEYQGGSPKEGDTATCHKDGGKIQFFAGEWMHLKGTGDSHNDVYPGKAKESSRKTAISLSNVGVESDTVGTGTDPSGKRVRFSITPAEAKQLKDILFSDLAINFSGVDVEESDIIREGAGPRRQASRAGDDFSWAFDKEKSSSRRKKVSNRRVAHNGWTNWDTWNAAMWINNEEGIYRAALGTESPEALRDLVEDFGLTGDGFDSDKVNWEEVWTDSEFGPNHQGSRRTSRMAGGPAPFGRSPRRHHAVDQADKPCASCGRPVGWLEVFPNFGGEGILCIDCYSETPEGRRMPTSDELTRMWGGPVRQGSRKVDTSRRTAGGGEAWQAAQEGGHASQVEFALSMLGVPEDQIDSATQDFLAQWDGSGDAGEQAQQWYDSRTASRKTAREAMVCETCGKEVEHADWDRCPHCGSSAGVEWETVASRRKTARSWIYSLKQIVESGQDGQIDGLPVGVELATGIVQATQTEGGRALLDRPFHEVYDMAVKAFAGAVFSSRRESSRRNHPSAGVDFSWAFANSKNSRKVQK